MKHRLPLAVSALAATLVASSAGANPPNISHYTLPANFVDDTSCSFSIQVDGVDKIVEQQFVDKDGNVLFDVFHDQFDATLTANGKTILESDHYTVLLDLVTGTSTYTGQPFRLRRVGGGPPIQRDAGIIRFDDQGSIVVEHGPHPFADGDVAAYCASLAP